jgi:hypothetical protein
VTHLGERASALVDGQLGAEASERAMAHLAGCRECRDAVELERLTKARLAFLGGPEPSGDLMGRLLAMGGPSGPLPPRPGHVPGTPRPKPVTIATPVPAEPVPAGLRAAVPGRAAVRTVLRSAVVRTGAGRAAPARPGSARPPAPPMPTTGTRRPGDRRRARVAGAVLGALGVVGAGVGGLVITAPTLSTPGGAGPAADNFTVQRASVPAPTPTRTPSNTTRLPSTGSPSSVPVSLQTRR